MDSVTGFLFQYIHKLGTNTLLFIGIKIAGDQDPYAPLRIQAELYTNLGRGADRTWSIIADADHAIHLLDGARERFAHVVKHFIQNGTRTVDARPVRC